MELKVIEQSPNKLLANIEGADNTLMNILVRQLQQDKRVIAAAYTIEHPLNPVPKLVLQTDGKAKPKDVLTDAIQGLKKEYDQFLSAFNKAFA